MDGAGGLSVARMTIRDRPIHTPAVPGLRRRAKGAPTSSGLRLNTDFPDALRRSYAAAQSRDPAFTHKTGPRHRVRGTAAAAFLCSRNAKQAITFVVTRLASPFP